MLRSLTVDVANDTLILWCVLLTLIHLLSYDYLSKSTGSPLSFNAIFLAAVLLSSRMGQDRSSFVLLFESLVLFGLGPQLRQTLKPRSTYELLTCSQTCLLATGLAYISVFAVAAYAALCGLITLVAPVLFIYAYGFKNDIRGPWDLPNVKEYKHA